MHLFTCFLSGVRHMAILMRALCLIFLLSACATSKQISQDFAPGTDFSTVKTFAWHNVSSAIPTINNLTIQRAIEQSLIKQGLQLVHANPDVVLDISIIAQKGAGSTTGLGLSLGLPLGNRGGIGLGTSKLLGNNTQQEGLIILDITNAANNQVMWRGTAQAVPMHYFLLRNEPQLNGILHRLIAQFPPK